MAWRSQWPRASLPSWGLSRFRQIFSRGVAGREAGGEGPSRRRWPRASCSPVPAEGRPGGGGLEGPATSPITPLAPSCLGRLLPILETPRRAGAPREKLPLRKTLNGFGCLPPCARPSELEEGGLRGVFFETGAAPSLFSPCGRVSGLERQVGQWEAVSVDNP